MSKRILIIDDEPHLVEVLANRLRKAGYEIVSAVAGREGLEHASKAKPDLILLDLLMPGLDGYHVLQELKQRENTKSIPVMILTVKKWSEDIEKVMIQGAVDYIVKPFNPGELLEKIKKVL